ncbi:MAG: hypothetical protein PVF13_03040 [Chromatiales bacterium]|jgi:hypothetical protein
MQSKQIEACIEAICQKGCRSVRQDILFLQRGEILPELKGLDDLACQMVLKELRAIMAVYGDSCPTPVNLQSENIGMKYEKNY